MRTGKRERQGICWSEEGLHGGDLRSSQEGKPLEVRILLKKE
jgi:hypothetical protein